VSLEKQTKVFCT